MPSSISHIPSSGEALSSSSSLTSDLRSPTSDGTNDGDQEVLVKAVNVSKIFCRDLKKSLLYGLKDSARDLVSWGRDKQSTSRDEARDLRPGEFHAVNNVSFELKRGECLGLIGHNGAGKTTLLKMLNGLIKPDSGHIEMRGKIGALIALGAGFNPILSGRENVYVNGAILGFTRAELDDKIDAIIEFAEIGDFIDAPVQTYSSGMQVRLGFSIASSMRPDVLVLDEVLAVGDIGFVIKCLNRVRELANSSAVIFVSHTMPLISSFCSRVIVMDKGTPLIDAAKPADGINCYYSRMDLVGTESGSGSATLENFELHADGRKVTDSHRVVAQGQDLEVRLSFCIHSSHQAASVLLTIDDPAQSHLIDFPLVDNLKNPALFTAGSHEITIPLGVLDVTAGNYSFLIHISCAATKIDLLRKSGIHPFRVTAETAAWAKIVRPVEVENF